MATRIKFCGMTRPDDAAYAVHLGVQEIGLVFAGGPRLVSTAQAREIIAELAPVTVTALFMNQAADHIYQVLNQVDLDQLQFHGQENAGFCDQFQLPWTKALAAGDQAAIEKVGLDKLIGRWRSVGQHGPVALVLDAHRHGERGGQGKVFDWQQVPAEPEVPIYLAGGLNVENVARAIREVRPYAVDVSSGIENSPGLKDHATMQRFVDEVRGADAEIDQQAG